MCREIVDTSLPKKRAHLLCRKPYGLLPKLNVEMNLVIRGFENNDIAAHDTPVLAPQTFNTSTIS